MISKFIKSTLDKISYRVISCWVDIKTWKQVYFYAQKQAISKFYFDIYQRLPFRPSLFQHPTWTFFRSLHFNGHLLFNLIRHSVFWQFWEHKLNSISGNGLNASITRIEHMKSLMLLHSKKIETIFDLIPRCKKFSKTVRDTIVVNTFTKLLLLRIVSFNRVPGLDGEWKWTVIKTFVHNDRLLFK